MLELLPANVELLRWLVKESGIQGVARVHNVAASNQTRRELAPSDHFSKFAGSEYKSLAAPWLSKRAARKYNGTMEVVALDDFVAREGLGDIFSVEIDTEGWDALVLEGLRSTLREHRVLFIEFEYSGRGYWGAPIRGYAAERRTLEGTTKWMAELGYQCFMQAGSDLAPISGPCWKPAFENGRWKNVLCAQNSLALGLLHNMSTRSFEVRHRREKGKSSASS